MKQHTFPKEERLRSKRLIADLFRHGSSFFIYPYRVTFIKAAEGERKMQVLFSVSKRRFPRAVHRNLLKRRMREAYRLQRTELLCHFLEKQPFSLAVAIQYVGNELLDYQTMYTRMANVLTKLQGECAKLHLGKGS